MTVQGRARVFGDDINTDYIISSARKRLTIDPAVLRSFIFESVAPGFADSVQPGDVIVAGRNFGCGSAMEIAVTVLQSAGIHAVVARSFSRSFYRNAINNGLLVLECETSAIHEGDPVAVRISADEAGVRVMDRALDIPGAPLPAIMLRILESGGLVPFLLANGGFRTSV